MGTKELLTKSHIPLEKLISKLREQNNLDVICSNIRHPSEEKTIFQICNKSIFRLYEKGKLVFKSIFQFAHALDCLQGGLTIFIALKNNAYILKTLEQIRKIFLSQGETSKAKEIESKIVKLGQEAL